jgi:hypothetical protein
MIKRFSFHLLAFSIFCLLFFSSNLSAQTVNGAVSDMNSRLLMPGVTVQLVCNGDRVNVVPTDSEGAFSIDVGGHEMCELVFSFIGYSRKSISVSEMRGTELFNVLLEAEALSLEMAVVSASISERPVEEEVVPIEVLKPYLASSTNAVGLKGLVGKTSGVSIMDRMA